MAGGWPYPLSLRMLNSLRPVLDNFSEHDLAFGLGLLAIRAGHIRWVEDHIATRLPPGVPRPESVTEPPGSRPAYCSMKRASCAPREL